MTDPITVFTARRIHTMDPSLPEATAIAVRDGRIIEVGNLESLQPWLTRHEHRIDDRFAEQVLVPGLIDPHVRPSMMAGLLACEWITGEDWDLPECHVPAVIGAEAFMDRVRDLEAGLPDGEPWSPTDTIPSSTGPSTARCWMPSRPPGRSSSGHAAITSSAATALPSHG
jgi:hypothetical protein